MFYLSGVAKQAVCLTWRRPQQQQKSQRAFSLALVRVCVAGGGGFCFRNNVLENVRPVIHFPQ